MTTPETSGPVFQVADTSDIPQMSYETARTELMTIVNQLEAGTGTLEQSLALWERGEALAQHCQNWLDGARERITARIEQVAELTQPGQTPPQA